jgi:hypothetical protein
VPNYYYSREHYLDIFKQCKLVVLSVELPHFNNEEDRVIHNKSLHSNAGLGKAYVSHAPFIIFKLKNGRMRRLASGRMGMMLNLVYPVAFLQRASADCFIPFLAPKFHILGRALY